MTREVVNFKKGKTKGEGEFIHNYYFSEGGDEKKWLRK